MKTFSKFLTLSSLLFTALAYADYNDIVGTIILDDRQDQVIEMLKDAKQRKNYASDDGFDINRRSISVYPEWETYAGYTLLMQAASRGQMDVVKALVLEFGADTKLTNSKGETARDIAARTGNHAIAKFLDENTK